MKKALLLLILLPVFGQSQSRVVLNNDGYIIIDNSAYLVLENSNPNAIITTGTGGNIVSENELDVIKWEIGTTTGTYIIPWTTKPVSQGGNGTKIPLSINKTTAGTGATAEFILSTYETATDMNTPYPSGVTNMNSSPPVVDESLSVVDRFWHIDALSYVAKPDVTLTINYDPAANEIGNTNTLIEANLLAQRFNTSLGSWESLLLGTNDAINDRVTGINVTAVNFFEDWILVDNLNPLPVELINFGSDCESGSVKIEWTTLTEINNNYFIVEKSYDAINFFELTTVNGAGNSNSIINYSTIDYNPSSGINYYGLKQVDFDGAINYHKIASVSCNPSNFTVDQIVLNNQSLNFNITTTQDEDITIYFYDYRGRIISSKSQSVKEGTNTIRLNGLAINTSLYMLSIVGEYNTYATKLIKR